jgi:hypothetical protein
MKKLLPSYVAIALLWWLVATALGTNSIPGAGLANNLGRNLPAAVIWPWQVVKSPYTFFRWITTPSIRAELKPLYEGCLVRTSDEDLCGCATRELRKQITDADAKAFEPATTKRVDIGPRVAIACDCGV